MNHPSSTVRWGALAILGTVLFFGIGCGDVFRPIANPVPTPGGDPQNVDFLTIMHCNGSTGRTGPLTTCSNPGSASSNSYNINIAGDSITSSAAIGVAPGFASFDINRAFSYMPDPATDTVRAMVPDATQTTGVKIVVATLPLGSKPIATFPGASQMYVLNAGSGSVCPNLGILNAVTLALTQTNCIGSSPSWVVETLNQAFVLDKALNQVNVYSTQQQKFIATIAVGTTPVWATVSFDGNFVYVLNQGSNNISIIDANALTVVNTVPTGGTGPVKGIVDSKLIRLYVLNQGSSTVTVFNALGISTLTQLGTITVGSNPVNLAVLPDGTRGFVANSGSNTITEFNAGSFTSRAITVGTDASALVTDVAASRDGSKIYAGFKTSGDLKNGITVIRASDETVVTTLSSPRQDLNCNPALTSCPRQQPQEFVGGR